MEKTTTRDGISVEMRSICTYDANEFELVFSSYLISNIVPKQ